MSNNITELQQLVLKLKELQSALNDFKNTYGAVNGNLGCFGHAHDAIQDVEKDLLMEEEGLDVRQALGTYVFVVSRLAPTDTEFQRLRRACLRPLAKFIASLENKINSQEN